MSGFKGRKWPFQFLLLTLMSEPNVGTSGCLVKETTRLREAGGGGGGGAKETAWKLKLLHCFPKEKEFLEIVSSIENTAEQWDGGEGGGCNRSVLMFSLGGAKIFTS